MNYYYHNPLDLVIGSKPSYLQQFASFLIEPNIIIISLNTPGVGTSSSVYFLTEDLFLFTTTNELDFCLKMMDVL